MDKKTIIRNFSRYAHTYDQYADAQNKAGIELLNFIKKDRFNRILELGCGTGNYTLLLKSKFKGAKIKAVDMSDKMVEVAADKLQDKGVEFMVIDAEKLDLDEKFDLVTSNACFQWFEDLEKALVKYKAMLKKRGVILFSVFGPLTFHELDFSLRSALKTSNVAAAGFTQKESIKKILCDNFKEAKIQEVTYEESFPSLIGLLNKIKYSGTGDSGVKPRFSLDRRLLEELEQAYLNKFGSIKTTYQIFFCQGRAI